jgi:hypothetical protein
VSGQNHLIVYHFFAERSCGTGEVEQELEENPSRIDPQFIIAFACLTHGIFLVPSKMSMLNNLKKTKPNAVFLDDQDEDDFDVDNMDFPLPTDSSSSGGATGLEDMMAKLSAGQIQRPATTSGKSGEIAVVNTPQGVQRVDPSVYKR